MIKTLYISGAVLGLLGVILGAFGAHALKTKLDPSLLDSFQTGVRYQMYHAFMFFILTGFGISSHKQLSILYGLFMLGIVLFCGSIYLLSTASLWNINFKPLGIITPIGGGLLILGWISLLLIIIKNKF